MMTNANIRQLMVIAAACLLLVGAGCRKETEQDKVKKVITSVQKAAEEKNVQEILKSLSKSYQDPQGYDRHSIKDLLLAYFYMHQKVHAYIPDMAISVEGASGKATFQTVLTGGQSGSAAGILPESLGVYAFEVVLRKEEGEWKVASARWNRAGE